MQRQILAASLAILAGNPARAGERPIELGAGIGAGVTLADGSSVVSFGIPGGGPGGASALLIGARPNDHLMLDARLALAYTDAEAGSFSLAGSSQIGAAQLNVLLQPGSSPYFGAGVAVARFTLQEEAATEEGLGAAAGYRAVIGDRLSLRVEARYRRWFSDPGANELGLMLGFGVLVGGPDSAEAADDSSWVSLVSVGDGLNHAEVQPIAQEMLDEVMAGQSRNAVPGTKTSRVVAALGMDRVTSDALPDLCGSLGVEHAVLATVVSSGADTVTVTIDRYDVASQRATRVTETAPRTAMLRVLRASVDGMLAAPEPAAAVARASGRRLGLQLRAVEPDETRRLGLPAAGVMIVRVSTGSEAHAAGLREGDVILELGEQPVTHPREWLQLVDANGSGPLAVRVWRDGDRQTVVVGAEDGVVTLP